MRHFLAEVRGAIRVVATEAVVLLTLVLLAALVASVALAVI